MSRNGPSQTQWEMTVCSVSSMFPTVTVYCQYCGIMHWNILGTVSAYNNNDPRNANQYWCVYRSCSRQAAVESSCNLSNAQLLPLYLDPGNDC
jgi:hypothetical protein